MDAVDSAETIYLGDRGLSGITIDLEKEQVRLSIDILSRVRGPEWNYYTAEDIPNGALVFGGVSSYAMTPSGVLPNDYIENYSVVPSHGEPGEFIFTMDVGSVGADAAYSHVQIIIKARSLHIEDPRAPDKPILT